MSHNRTIPGIRVGLTIRLCCGTCQSLWPDGTCDYRLARVEIQHHVCRHWICVCCGGDYRQDHTGCA